MSVLLTILFTHLCVDYIFQKNKTALLKKQGKSCEKTCKIFLHSFNNMIVGIITFCAMCLFKQVHNESMFSFLNFLILLFIVSFIHWIIDLSKSKICYWIGKIFSNQKGVITYIFDQLLHLLSILFGFMLITVFFPADKNFQIENQVKMILQNHSYVNNILCFLIIVILITKFSDYFIAEFLEGTGVKNDGKIKAEKIGLTKHLGSYIGNLERLTILVFFFSNSIASVSIVVAIKAITRFKKLEKNEDNFAEYYLIGSMLSLLLGCLFSSIAVYLIPL